LKVAKNESATALSSTAASGSTSPGSAMVTIAHVKGATAPVSSSAGGGPAGSMAEVPVRLSAGRRRRGPDGWCGSRCR
jgi:hypothetical protein